MKETGPTGGNSLPSLPPSLSQLYSGLTIDNQRVFIKVFRWLWRYVNGKHIDIIHLFWCANLFRMRLGLDTSELAVLAFLYSVSGRGVSYVHSDTVYNSDILPGLLHDSYSAVLSRLKQQGFITRHTSDPLQPYLKRSYSRHALFIKLTPAGVRLIQGIDHDIYYLMLNTSLDDLTGNNKKG